MTPIEELERLEEERRFLLESLRDLERERQSGDISEDDYVGLRDQYTAQAASVLRALRRGEAKNQAPPPPSRPLWSRQRTGLTITALLVLVVLAAALVVNTAGPRREGEPATGTVDSPVPAGRMDQALDLERRGRPTDALKVYDAILGDDPDNVAALAYRGWLLHRAGLTDKALESLDRAVSVDPNFPDAHFFRGMALYEGRKDPSAAIPEFRAFLANRPPPEMVAPVEAVLNRALADAGQAGGSSSAPATATAPPPPTSP